MILVFGNRKFVVANECTQHIMSEPLVLIAIAVVNLEGFEILAENALGTGQETGTILYLIKCRHKEVFTHLTDVHQARMTTARDTFQRVAFLFVVVHPEITPDTDVCGIIRIDSHLLIYGYAVFALSIEASNLFCQIAFDGCVVILHLLVNHHNRLVGILLFEDDEREGLYAVRLCFAHFGIIEVEKRVALLF